MKLIDYITGNRKGREARRIEREAMDDPFLHDALEGYDAVPGDPTDAIRRMQRRVTGAAGKLRRRIYWSAAAALLLCAETVAQEDCALAERMRALARGMDFSGSFASPAVMPMISMPP